MRKSFRDFNVIKKGGRKRGTEKGGLCGEKLREIVRAFLFGEEGEKGRFKLKLPNFA